VPNVLVVYDGLAAQIGACEARPGLAKCGGAKCRRGRSPNGVLRNPSRRKTAKR